MSQSLKLEHSLAGPSLGWGGAAAAVIVACIAILAIFSRDVSAALTVWQTSSAYSHCYLILPVSLYLIYSRRSELRAIEPSPSWVGAAIFVAGLIVWWLGMAAAITELRQFAIIGMLQGAVLCLAGWRVYRCILFPMLYLFLLVPSGTALLGPLQTLTTKLSALLLGFTGIPILVGDHIIEAPTGLYEVAPGCAGLNFLLATLALSLIYALTLYQGWFKRFLAVLLALALSIATNQLRVFGIIWLAEATKRKIDIVDDHLLYGWGVYCAVMVAAMFLGFLFRDPPSLESPACSAKPTRSSWAQPWFAALALVILAGAAETSFAAANPPMPTAVRINLELPARMGDWSLRDSGASLPLPPPANADALYRVAYAKPNRQIDLLIAYYWRQREGHKIDDIAAGLSDESKSAIEGRAKMTVDIAGTPMTVDALKVSVSGHKKLLWSYDWVGGHRTTNPLMARLLGMGATIGADGRSAVIVMSANDDDGQGRARLADFLDDAQPLDGALSGAQLGADF